MALIPVHHRQLFTLRHRQHPASILLRPFTPLSPLVCNSRKGFGDVQQSGVDERTRKTPKSKRVNVRREEAPIPNQGNLDRGGGAVNPAFAAVTALEEDLKKKEEDAEFAKRLALIKVEGEERRREALSTSAGSGGATAGAAAVFDTKLDYSSPPSLSETLMNSLNSDVSDPALKQANIGPNQIGVAAAAVLLVIMFLVVSGGDFATTKRYKGLRPATAPPDGIDVAMIKGRIALLENARGANPSDLSALEEEAVSYAQLFEFEKAAELLDKLVASRPKDGEAWRLLGETTLLSQQASRSVTAYEKAVALSSDDLQILTGLTDAYIANGQPAKAVEYINKRKSSRATPPPTDTMPVATSTASSSGATNSADSKSESASTSDPAPSAATIDAATLDLLLGKAFASWRGHDNDALAVYDGLIQTSPEDFRGYLAKGLFLKERGRKADAERMFIQARFYAPESRRSFITRVSENNPLLDLPSDD